MRQIRWINELAAGLMLAYIAAAARVLHELSDRPEMTARTGRDAESDKAAT
jgi:hypothetical protein